MPTALPSPSARAGPPPTASHPAQPRTATSTGLVHVREGVPRHFIGLSAGVSERWHHRPQSDLTPQPAARRGTGPKPVPHSNCVLLLSCLVGGPNGLGRPGG